MYNVSFRLVHQPFVSVVHSHIPKGVMCLLPNISPHCYLIVRSAVIPFRVPLVCGDIGAMQVVKALSKPCISHSERHDTYFMKMTSPEYQHLV